MDTVAEPPMDTVAEPPMDTVVELGRLLAPRSIAVVGSSRVCGRVVEQNRALGFRGPIWPVHPTAREDGRRAGTPPRHGPPGGPGRGVRRRARALDARRWWPSSPRRAAAVPSCTARASPRRARAGWHGSVTCSPPRGRCRSSARTATALVNYAAQALIWPDQHGGVGLAAGERGVAVVSQSSSIAISVTMVDVGLPLHSVVAVGNAAQLGVAQVGRGAAWSANGSPRSG